MVCADFFLVRIKKQDRDEGSEHRGGLRVWNPAGPRPGGQGGRSRGQGISPWNQAAPLGQQATSRDRRHYYGFMSQHALDPAESMMNLFLGSVSKERPPMMGDGVHPDGDELDPSDR
jgi:hypothetical protein